MARSQVVLSALSTLGLSLACAGPAVPTPHVLSLTVPQVDGGISLSWRLYASTLRTPVSCLYAGVETVSLSLVDAQGAPVASALSACEGDTGGTASVLLAPVPVGTYQLGAVGYAPYSNYYGRAVISVTAPPAPADGGTPSPTGVIPLFDEVYPSP